MAKLSKEELLSRREEIAERYIRTPIVYFLVRAWLFSWRARVGMVLAFLAFLLAVFATPKIWRTTPEEVRPVVKISLVDAVKAVALERNARKYMAQGREDYGLMAFNASIANNEGSVRRVREFVKLVTAREMAREELPLDTVTVKGIQRAEWLTKLSKDPNDLEVALRLFEALEFNEDLLGMAGITETNLTEGSKKLALKALLREGHVEQFENYWTKWAPAGGWTNDVEMSLYRATVTAAFGAAEKAPEARAFVEAQMKGEHKVVAHRLYLMLCAERQNVPEYERALNQLKEWRQDRLIDHARHWQLLAAAGRKEEGLKMADQFNRAPRTSIETSQLAAAYYDLGMKEEARDLLAQFIDRYGFYERLWVQQGRILAGMKDWTGLRGLVAKMRLEPSIAHRMMGYSFYLEGRAEMGEGRTALAQDLFSRIPEHEIPNLQVAFLVIDEMRSMGQLEVAAKMIERIEEQSKNSPRYWMFVTQLADEMKNTDLLRKATAETHRLLPEDPAAKSNYAAALLADRAEPEKAIKLTFELLTSAPENPAFQINHASALAQNKRFADAEKELEEVNIAGIAEPEVKTAYYYTLAEALVGQERWARAAAALGRIEDRFLYPKQLAEVAKWREAAANDGAPAASASSK